MLQLEFESYRCQHQHSDKEYYELEQRIIEMQLEVKRSQYQLQERSAHVLKLQELAGRFSTELSEIQEQRNQATQKVTCLFLS